MSAIIDWVLDLLFVLFGTFLFLVFGSVYFFGLIFVFFAATWAWSEFGTFVAIPVGIVGIAVYFWLAGKIKEALEL